MLPLSLLYQVSMLSRVDESWWRTSNTCCISVWDIQRCNDEQSMHNRMRVYLEQTLLVPHLHDEMLQWPSLSQRRYFQNSAYVAEFSVVFPSFPRLFSLYLLALSPRTRTPFLFPTLSWGHNITNPPSNTPWCPFGTKCPITSLTHLFPRTLSSAHSDDILQILLEPFFVFFWLCVFLCTFLFCCSIFVRLAFTIAFAIWSFACMLWS